MINYNRNSLKIKFKGCEMVSQNYSQAAQDLFVLSCLNGKQNGTFLDLGCNDGISINNTYLLESVFGWTGLSMDIENRFASSFENRKSTFLNRDCVNLNYDEVLSYYKSNHIDYLSLDLEPASVTYECLQNIPFDRIEFSVITFEHDSYRFGNGYRDLSRDIFKQAGYELVCSDVSNGENIYEDWYYNPKYVKSNFIAPLQCDSNNWSSIVYSV